MRHALFLFALLGGCAPVLDDDDLAAVDDDDATTDDDDATADDDDSVLDDDDVVGTGPVPVEICQGPGSAPVSVARWDIPGGDSLVGDVEYGGGCEVHDFRLCWDGLFLESLPVQVNLWVRDLGPPDPCDAWVTEPVEFDLEPLSDLWVESYGPPPGEIVVNLAGQSVSYTF